MFLGYLITVQFLMTFNFCVMFLVLVLLILEYISLRQSGNAIGRFLFDITNSYDTGMKFAVLVYIFYVLGNILHCIIHEYQVFFIQELSNSPPG